MWFIARKTLDNSCACRCYITFEWESKWLRSDGKKGTKTKKNERMKDSKKIHWELMYITKKKEKFFSYLFNDTKIYCIPLFIATQTIPSDILSWAALNVCAYFVNICCETLHNRQFLRCCYFYLVICAINVPESRSQSSSLYIFFFFRRVIHNLYTFNGHGPCNLSSYVISHDATEGKKCA